VTVTILKRRHPRRTLQLASLCCALASLPIAVTAQSDDFPNRVIHELAGLKQGVTLREWRQAHSADSVTLYSHLYREWNGNWVARAARHERMPGRKMTSQEYIWHGCIV